mgnify:CR=1 FL=1
MKILIATPLYPPDIAKPALYIKEFARRLSLKKNVVTVIAYSKLPEETAGVQIVGVNKRHPLLIRLFIFIYRLWQNTRTSDVIYTQNGPSVELPVFLVSFFTQKPIIVLMSDRNAHLHAQNRRFLSFLERLLKKQSRTLITDMPLEKPEILPFKQYPESAMKDYESSWKRHLDYVEKKITYA